MKLIISRRFHSKNGHNFIGDYNYYVMPKDVYDKVKGEIPYEVGVLVSDMKKDYGRITLYHAKNAKRKDRNKPLSEMLLMMFRSAVRDTISKWYAICGVLIKEKK